MKEKGMVKHNKDVSEIQEDTKFIGEKERDSACVMKQGKNDLTMMQKDGIIMMEKEKESKCVTKKKNNDLTMMEKDDIAKKEKGMVKHNKDVCEIKEDTKFVGEKERDSACVLEQGQSDLTMMEKYGFMTEKEMDQDAVMENVMDNDKSESTDSLALHTVLDASIMDRVMDTQLKSTPTTYTSKEVSKESSKVYCMKQESSMSINPRKFYKVDGILLEDENSENYPRIINQKAREKIFERL